MATNTPNYGFKKPAYTDPVDINDINGNFDKVDTELNSISYEVGNLSDLLNQINFSVDGGNLSDINLTSSFSDGGNFTDTTYSVSIDGGAF